MDTTEPDGRTLRPSAVPALPLDTTVGHLLRRAQQVHTALWAREFAGDLTGPQYALLSALTRRSETDQGTAGRLASLDKSTTADVVARLQRSDWLVRHRHPDDGRRYLLALTTPARSALRHITPRAAGIQRTLLEPLGAGDTSWFVGALARVAYGGEPVSAAASAEAATALDLAVTPGHLIRRSEQLHGVHWARHVGPVITPSQYGLLSALVWNAPLDQGSAGELASLDKSSTADIVARMIRRGLVERVADPGDRRRKLVVLAEGAREVLDRITPAVAAVQDDVTAPLDPAARRRFTRLLHAVAYHVHPT